MTSTPKMVVAAIIGTLVYLGLALLGWGGIETFFADPARTAVFVITLALLVAALPAGGNLSRGEHEDRDNRWVLAAFGILGLLNALVPPYCDRHGALTIGGEATRWIGVALYALGGGLRLWPVYVLGYRFSGLVAIQPGHQLVTTGPYALIRNPSYTGLLVNSFGWSLAFRSLVGVALTALMLIPLIARMRSEEALLREQFGKDYDDYFARTKRLLPWLY